MTGIVLTRVDGDGRGGAALSMRSVTGKPIKLIGTGEKLDALEDFDPARIAGRILGMGDIVSLVEKAAATIDAEKAARVAEKMRKGAFDLGDLREQLTQMQQMGGIGGLMGMLPGVAKMKNQLQAANLDERVLKRQMAIIDSMTPRERRNPDLLKASRKRRIAEGSGTKPEDINRLLKMHRGMADMMKAMAGAKRGPMAGLAQTMGFGGGMPSPEEMQKLAEKMPALPPQNAVGVALIKSVKPGQMVVKLVHDQLVETLGASADPIDLNAPAPVGIMMVGLQGSGKTTTTAKIARRLTEQGKRKVLMASLDTRRPAAMEQLAVLGQPGERADAADRDGPDAAADRAPRARGWPARRLRRGDVRHRGPHHARRRDDGGSRQREAGREPARSAARRGRAHRPGRRQSRALVQRARRA